jgi:jouberin
MDVRRMFVVQDIPEQVEVVSSTGANFDIFEDLLDHRHPNTIVYDGSRRMYVGDSLGSIHVYDINTTMSSQYIAKRIGYVVNPEMAGDAITCLKLVPPEMKDLLVHSRDNCVRVLEVNSSDGIQNDNGQSTGSIASRFFGAVTQKLCIHSTPSPCGEYILSGSEDGKPYLWDNVSII